MRAPRKMGLETLRVTKLTEKHKPYGFGLRRNIPGLHKTLPLVGISPRGEVISSLICVFIVVGFVVEVLPTHFSLFCTLGSTSDGHVFEFLSMDKFRYSPSPIQLHCLYPNQFDDRYNLYL